MNTFSHVSETGDLILKIDESTEKKKLIQFVTFILQIFYKKKKKLFNL